MIYRTEVQWGNKRIIHYSFTYRGAVEWMSKYPKQDVFATVKRIFKPGALAVRYYR